MLMQGSINVEFSVSSTAILLAWYSVIQTYFMVGNSLQLSWQKDTKKKTWFSDNTTRKSDKKNGNNENEPSFLRLVHIQCKSRLFY
jgi:hypothetical protein